MSLEYDVARACIQKWFAERNKPIVEEGNRYFLGKDYAVLYSIREHNSVKHKVGTSANYKPSEFQNFEDKVLNPRGIRHYHMLIIRTFLNEGRYDPEYCYFVEVPQTLLTDRAHRARLGINQSQDNLYFYFDDKGGRNNQYSIPYWLSSTYKVRYQLFHPERRSTWSFDDSPKDSINASAQKLGQVSKSEPLKTGSDNAAQKQFQEELSRLERDLLTIEQSDLGETEKEAIYRYRVGHSALKDRALKTYRKCRFCDISFEPMLIASHIKPWSKCTSSAERLDLENVLLLCANHDALFDKLLITFQPDGRLVPAPVIGPRTVTLTGIEKIKVQFTPKEKQYLKWHYRSFMSKWGSQGRINPK
ncbi:HNH endonuclease [Paenibacillus cremeus]|uniref:HNH nuclease domain-containing protein n=1 Tax=Paenibacillus cremeus TaxID=2163881 RepID=A0A559K363_9BACL|nr:HNH endonuclease [Paenibacillus cremeus]TVY06574.1 hypothetical protein FPZ49_28675 [Paenibacillus cremeus]